MAGKKQVVRHGTPSGRSRTASGPPGKRNPCTQAFMDGRNNHDECPSDQALGWLGRLVVGIVGLYLLTQVIGRIMRRVRPGLTPLRAIPNLNMPLRWQFFGTPADLGSCWDQPWHAGPGDRARARLRDGALGRACLC